MIVVKASLKQHINDGYMRNRLKMMDDARESGEMAQQVQLIAAQRTPSHTERKTIRVSKK